MKVQDILDALSSSEIVEDIAVTILVQEADRSGPGRRPGDGAPSLERRTSPDVVRQAFDSHERESGLESG